MDLCVCESISKKAQQIEIKVVNKRFGKVVTVIGGLDPKAIDVKELAKHLKSKLACGGTTKGDVIELQGEHKEKVKELLTKYGFSKESIIN